jgi:hypothetical protein
MRASSHKIFNLSKDLVFLPLYPNYPFPLCRVRKKMDLPCVGLRMFRIRGPIPIRIIES